MSFLCTRAHLIWSTAKREPWIDKLWQPRLHGYLRGILENLKAHPLAICGMPEHVHVYSSLPATVALVDLASTLKSNSSAWVRGQFCSEFAWQDVYAAFTMSKSADADVIAYILGQEEHHRQRSFQEELLAFLEKFEVPYDPRYVFF